MEAPFYDCCFWILYLKKKQQDGKKIMTTKKVYPFQKERTPVVENVTLTYYSKKGQSFVAFPLRVVYLPMEEEMPARASFLVSVPKKRFKRAVKRNLIKRQVREAYRVRKYDLLEPLEAKNKGMLIAFLYLDKRDPSVRCDGKGNEESDPYPSG